MALGVSAVGAVPPPRSRGFSPCTLTGGVVAFNDESRLERSVRSLLAQELPPGVLWSRIWLVASGCTDGTVEVGRTLAAEDARVRLIVEPERRGKAAAIREVLARAGGETVVLLNSDAVAQAGAVAALLETAAGRSGPFAVMARPVVPLAAGGEWVETLRWMWELHHELHLEMLAEGTGAHLSDELILLHLPASGVLAEGVINDGSFLGVWLAQNRGGCWYAPESRVVIDVPPTVSDHLSQRRRIHVGNAQVRRMLGSPPTTLPRYFLEEPERAMRMLRALAHRRSGLRHILRVAFWELVAHALALWDRVPPARDHVRWRRIRSGAGEPATDRSSPADAASAGIGEIDHRVRSILGVARDFSTGVPLDQLLHLLPSTAPSTASELARWLGARPELARVDDGRAYAPSAAPRPIGPRSLRGERYRKWAEELASGPLRVPLRWCRCLGVTGSAAYGEPLRGDDLDLFVVTQAGSLWCFLALTFGILRLRRLAGADPERPEPCFNYAIDDSVAAAELEQDRGFLFARESLTLHPVLGDPYYRGLLARAPWMGGRIPRLYSERTRSPGDCSSDPAPFWVRVLNGCIYPILATYLQLVGIRRNARGRRVRGAPAEFRTRAEPRRLSILSRRFEEIRGRYEPNAVYCPRPEGMAGPSRIPTAR